ncbi:MerR family transcriptional regulator [Lentzea rhizosphaerae]|uniref:MerR family transcriptional regulator n=1 Tax=Lentzea rhizosphaerae TaxID=2041025 RepID=A0ABV8BSD0_9PSEU
MTSKHAAAQMTIDEFAAEIGMTTRTVRSYQARGLLPAPNRLGRSPMYDDFHLTRMRTVLRLQHRGLPLEAIRALLAPDLVLRQFLPAGDVLVCALRQNAELLHAAIDCGVVTQLPDGSLELPNARAVLAAGRTGAPIGHTVSVLVQAVSALRPHAEPALAEVRRSAPSVPPENLAELVVEAFRLAVMSVASRGVPRTA